MAKRKRLSPAAVWQGKPPVSEIKAGPGPAPIARVAAETSAAAALEEVSQALASARAEGRMIELIPLEEIDAHHLMRDRLDQNEDEMAALTDSLRARGQQTPIEVTPLPASAAPHRFGLISGWRRMTALKRLYEETSDSKFSTIRAVVVAPETAQDAYVAMVEENEIRVNLSHYERARIVVRALGEGVYPDRKQALRGLFGNTTRSRRSKIGTFIALVEAFDAHLRFPYAISEKLGLGLAKALAQDPGFAAEVVRALTAASPASPAEEAALLARLLADRRAAPVRDMPRAERISVAVSEDVEMLFLPDRSRIELVGRGVTEDLAQALQAWFRGR